MPFTVGLFLIEEQLHIFIPDHWTRDYWAHFKVAYLEWGIEVHLPQGTVKRMKPMPTLSASLWSWKHWPSSQHSIGGPQAWIPLCCVICWTVGLVRLACLPRSVSFLPHSTTCIPPLTAHSVTKEDHPQPWRTTVPSRAQARQASMINLQSLQ